MIALECAAVGNVTKKAVLYYPLALLARQKRDYIGLAEQERAL